MTKNIAVIDEQGNRYEATYPKRAKGLVKNGRARFVDESTICLACPPNQSEDKKMSEEKINTVMDGFDSTIEELRRKAESFLDGPQGQGGEDQATQAFSRGMEELKKQAESFSDGQQGQGGEDQTAQIFRRKMVEFAMDELRNFEFNHNYFTNLVESMEGEELVKIVEEREATRRKQLELYRWMLERALDGGKGVSENFVFKTPPADEAFDKLQRLTDWVADLDQSNFDDDLWDQLMNSVSSVMSQLVLGLGDVQK